MNQIIEQNKNAVERMIEHRRKQIDDLVGSLIVFFLEENLPFYDAYYVCQRAFEILQKTTDKASFESEEIKKLRKALLKKKINEVRRDLWGFAKELEELRALPDIKPEEAQRIQQLEHIIKKEPQNET
jgi:recombinational DNA repair protein RecR